MGAWLRRTWARLTPGTNSVATQGCPSWSPTPNTAAMFGWPRAPAASASRRSRPMAAMAFLGADVKSFTAAVRSCSGSQAT